MCFAWIGSIGFKTSNDYFQRDFHVQILLSLAHVIGWETENEAKGLER